MAHHDGSANQSNVALSFFSRFLVERSIGSKVNWSTILHVCIFVIQWENCFWAAAVFKMQYLQWPLGKPLLRHLLPVWYPALILKHMDVFYRRERSKVISALPGSNSSHQLFGKPGTRNWCCYCCCGCCCCSSGQLVCANCQEVCECARLFMTRLIYDTHTRCAQQFTRLNKKKALYEQKILSFLSLFLSRHLHLFPPPPTWAAAPQQRHSLDVGALISRHVKVSP